MKYKFIPTGAGWRQAGTRPEEEGLYEINTGGGCGRAYAYWSEGGWGLVSWECCGGGLLDAFTDKSPNKESCAYEFSWRGPFKMEQTS